MTPTASIQMTEKSRQEEPTNTASKMQNEEGKASRKSDEIAETPRRGTMADVTPRSTISEREQANSKKARQVKKKGLENYFGVGARVPPPSLEGSPADAVGKRKAGDGKEAISAEGEGRRITTPGLKTPPPRSHTYNYQRRAEEDRQGKGRADRTALSKKSSPKGSDDDLSRRSKKTRSDDDASVPEKPANLEAIKGLLRKKGQSTPPSGSSKKDKKTATFAEAVKADPPKKSAPKITLKKCVVAFSVRVDKGKDTQAAFGKKIIAALSFVQSHIDKHAAFLAIDSSDSSRPPIKEKADLPGFQVILKRYFAIPNERAFDNVNQDGGRAIRGSAVMGFSLDPKKCLDEAAGDLRHMGCAIFFKQCQEVNTVARQLLLGAPNTIEDEIIQQTFDYELKLVETRLIEENNAEYKYPEHRLSKWIKFAVVREYPAGMPWEGADEKKQKQGTNNARLAYVLHVHEQDYNRMRTLLAFAKAWKVWNKHWGDTAFTVEIPNEKSPQAEKTRYIQMVQTHGAIQLSMGAAMLEGLIDVDTEFSLRLLPDADGKAREPTTTSIREIFSLMEIKGHKIWICMSTGLNGRTTGYFSSVVQEISEHVEAFIACPGAQVYWWLRRRGCLTDDINRLIRHCFSLFQQQKVTASKYLKDLGHAVVDNLQGDDIIQASSALGIYDLTLGLSDKERRSLASRGHNAAAITYGEAKEGAIEAHNFSAALSITSLRSAKKGDKDATKLQAKNRTLEQSVYSITSKVTNESEEKLDNDEALSEDGSEGRQELTFDGMEIVKGNDSQAAMIFTTGSMEDKDDGEMEVDIEGSLPPSDDSTWKDTREVSSLTAKMKKATSLLQLDNSEEDSNGSDFAENDQSVHSDDLDLDLDNYDSDALEVSSGEFNAHYTRKYATPKTFLHTLWNVAGPSAGAMRICLEIILNELKGQMAGVPADFKDLSEELIQYMYKEAGDDPTDVIEYITQIHHDISNFEEKEEGESDRSHRTNQDDELDPNANAPELTDGETQEASKPHETLPRSHQTSPAEGTAIVPATEAGGDEEGMQSMSMAGNE